MSLDVSLIDGTRTEHCYHCDQDYEEDICVFDYNITHNLSQMAEKAGVYKALWRPEELNIKEAGGLIHILESGLADLKNRPAYFKNFNPPNGWGHYDGLVDFVEKYLKACKENKTAKIWVSR